VIVAKAAVDSIPDALSPELRAFVSAAGFFENSSTNLPIHFCLPFAPEW